MPSGLRYRFWLESIFGSITGVAALVTLFRHDWIEAVFGVDPDKGPDPAGGEYARRDRGTGPQRPAIGAASQGEQGHVDRQYRLERRLLVRREHG